MDKKRYKFFGNAGNLLLLLLMLTGSLNCIWAQSENESGVTEVFVKNAGIGGNNTVDLLGRIEKDCLAFEPQLTILMVGTNDMNSVKYVPIAEYEQNLRHLVETLKAGGSKVLLLNILPFYTPHLLTRHPKSFYGQQGPEGRQAEMNKVIARVAADQQVAFLDVHHFFEAVGKLGLSKYSLIRNEANSGKQDGIHPTVDGYRLLASVIYQKIIMGGLPHSRVVCFGDSITKGDGSIDGNSYPAFLKRLLLDKMQ